MKEYIFNKNDNKQILIHYIIMEIGNHNKV